MCTSASRPFARWILLAALLGAVGMGTSLFAQVTCYRTRCAVYPDGSRICERVPVDCSTIRL
jgi:hypothetical protein